MGELPSARVRAQH